MLAVLCLGVLGSAESARAFTDPGSFYAKPVDGGGGGRWFTGAPPDGYGCGVCHSGSRAEDLVVEGLPAQGYTPGETYRIRIAWPEVAARTRPLYMTQPANMIPRASLIAEFVSENGADSGRLEQLPLSTTPETELCNPSVSKLKRFGYSFYRQAIDKGTKIVNICDGVNFTRCLIAVKGCGSEAVSFDWTAPVDYQGTIFFSAGFVATDVISQTPEQDAVTEVTLPIKPAGASEYETTLGQTCSVSPSPASKRPIASLVVFGAVLFGFCRRRTRQSRGGNHDAR